MPQDNIRDLLYQKLENDFINPEKHKLTIQQYILEIENFLTDN